MCILLENAESMFFKSAVSLVCGYPFNEFNVNASSELCCFC